jgi:hypothetical protein
VAHGEQDGAVPHERREFFEHESSGMNWEN